MGQFKNDGASHKGSAESAQIDEVSCGGARSHGTGERELYHASTSEKYILIVTVVIAIVAVI